MSGVTSLRLPKKVVYGDDQFGKLQYGLVNCSFINLFLTACLGLLLRTFPYLSSFPLDYKNILHGHSHFAFGGWVMPVLLALVVKCFPELRKTIAFKHWRNIAVLKLLSAYGMLIAFPLQGYQTVSISFSTVSLLSGFYLAVVVWKGSRLVAPSLSLKFLNAGLFYHVLSSAGPFATAPLIIMGKAGTPLYFDVIYFFLHFQYNGFFTFTVLALIFKMLERQKVNVKEGHRVYLLLHSACIPAYCLSVLWHQPSIIFNIIGGLAAALQLAALIYFVKDAVHVKWSHRFIKFLFTLSLTAFILKNILQFLSAFPLIASITYEYRNFVIAYLHLVLLGFISLFTFSFIFQSFYIRFSKSLQLGIFLFLTAFLTTELFLVSSAAAGLWGFIFPGLSLGLFIFSCLFPISLLILFVAFVQNTNLPKSKKSSSNPQIL